MNFVDCPECDASPKEGNLESHVRDTHPREYLDHYPHAPEERGLAPCPECWEWLSTEETVRLQQMDVERLDGTYRHTADVVEFDAHMAREHTRSYDEHNPDGCVMCALGYVHPFWPPSERHGLDEDTVDFLYGPDGLRLEAAHTWLEERTGLDLPAEAFERHWEEGHWSEEGFSVKPSREAECGMPLWRHMKRPTEIEVDVFEATEAGEEYTVRELAEATGRTPSGIRRREESLLREGILDLVHSGRPATYRATGEHDYDDDKFVPKSELECDGDPEETDARPHEDFESLYGHPRENGGMSPPDS